MSDTKQKKKTIPKVMRDLAWNKWIGEDVAKHKCMCCEVNEIRMNSFHCGHVIAEANGGLTSVENLRPICKACNLSMGTENLFDFKKRCGLGQNTLESVQVEKKEEPVVIYEPGILNKYRDSSGYMRSIPKQIKMPECKNKVMFQGRMVSTIDMAMNTAAFNELRSLYTYDKFTDIWSLIPSVST